MQKRLNRSRCRLGAWLLWDQGTILLIGSRSRGDKMAMRPFVRFLWLHANSAFHPFGVDKWVVSCNWMSATSVRGGAIWWTLTKERQAWCTLQVKLCDPCLSRVGLAVFRGCAVSSGLGGHSKCILSEGASLVVEAGEGGRLCHGTMASPTQNCLSTLRNYWLIDWLTMHSINGAI